MKLRKQEQLVLPNLACLDLGTSGGGQLLGRDAQRKEAGEKISKIEGERLVVQE